MHRKGSVGDQVSFFAFFFIMIIIGAGIAGGVYMFFAKGYDFRGAEAELLSNKIKDCVIENGESVLNKNVFFEQCNLNKEIIESNDIIKICKNANDCVSDEAIFTSGSDFTACGIKGAKGNEGYVKCAELEFEINKDRFFIITGSKQAYSRRVG